MCCDPGHIALFFPRKSTQDYVVAEKPFVKNLTAFTVGMWVQMANDSKTKLSTTVFFSYAIINGSDNNRELFFEMDAHEVWLGIRTIQKRHDMPENFLDEKWHHVCLIWENSFGKYYFHIDGVKIFEGIVANGDQIRAPGAIVLGQEQRTYIGGFNEYQSFTGNLTSVNMWDKALDPSGVEDLAKRCPTVEGNLVKWSDLYAKLRHGAVQLVCQSSCE
ncbi:hypothetical protein QZH41_013810 [Actinostola sp. cb2023]|nr:hypothetical protein QZH41_013810 [Actinostola sp. cb2023]